MNSENFIDRSFLDLGDKYRGNMVVTAQYGIDSYPAFRTRDLHHLHETKTLLEKAPKTAEAAEFYIIAFQHIQMYTPEGEIARCAMFNGLFPTPLPQATPRFNAKIEDWTKIFGPLKPIKPEEYERTDNLPKLSARGLPPPENLDFV